MEVYKKIDGNLLRMDTNNHPLMTKDDYIESIEYSVKQFKNMPEELTRIMFNFIEDWLKNAKSWEIVEE